ncbi:MAG: type II CAAX endopeptidase family protein [Pseudomonadota bacterium]
MFPTPIKPSRRLLVVLLLAAVCGAAAYARLRPVVFRGASLDLKMSRRQALDRAKEFLGGRGYDLAGANSSAKFWSYETPAIYLEKRLGTEEANRVIREERMPLFGWEVRFFRPLQKEEYSVWWSPQGDLIGFDHDILREKELPSVSARAARAEAEAFLRQHFPDLFPRYLAVESSEEQKPGRIDRSFRWRAPKAPLEIRLYLSATVSGSEITSARYEVEVPEVFVRSEQSVQEKRDLLTGVTRKIDFLLTLSMAVCLLMFWRRHWLRWKGPVLIASIVLLFGLLGQVNEIPLKFHDYTTTKTLAAFWFTEIGYSFLIVLVSAVWLTLQLTSADATGRTSPGATYSLGEVAAKRFFRSRSFITATIAGFAAAGIQLGFVVLYYVAGSRFFHFYAPLEVQYDDLLTTALPWVSPLLTGLGPALTEEATYRLFAIPLLLKLTGRRWVAVVLPAILWGFMHTSYYVEPIYARGLELTLVGIFLGVVFLRYGIWATLVGHYVYNATLSSSLLLSSHSLYLQVSSALVIGALAIPLAVAVVRWIRGAEPADLPFSPLSWPSSSSQVISLIDRRRRVEPSALASRWPVIVSVAALCLLILGSNRLRPPPITVDRDRAIQTARDEVGRLGYVTDGFLVASGIAAAARQDRAARYVEENLSADENPAYLEKYQSTAPRWSVEFLSPSTPAGCGILLSGEASVVKLQCQLGEDEPGKSLSSAETRKLAEAYLVSLKTDPSKLRYVGATEQERPRRKDYEHEWNDPSASVAQLKRYISVEVAGERISSFSTYLKPPESYLRQLSAENVWSSLKNLGMALLAVILAYALFRSFFDRIVITSFRSGLALALASLSALIAGVDWWNRLPSFWAAYESSVTVPIYLGHQVLNLFGRMLAYGLGSYVLLVLFLRLPPQLFPDAPSAHDLQAILRRPPWRWRQARSMFLWALGLAFVQTFLFLVPRWLDPSLPQDLFSGVYQAYSSEIPLLAVAAAVWNSVLCWIAFAVGFAACRKYLPAWLVYASLGLFIFVLASGRSGSRLEALQMIASLLLTAWVVLERVRFRLPFYVWYSLLQASLPFAPWLVSMAPSLRWQAFFVLAFTLTVTAAIFFPRPRRRPAQEAR